jgi:uncharacterized protein (TIGR02996 family)
MRTFQCDRGETRFWTIAQDGQTLSLTFGVVGTPGRTQTVKHTSVEHARKDLDRRVKQKVKEGYVEKFTFSPLHQALADAVLADPDDLAAHMALADWLFEQSDPGLRARGEFAQVQLALEDSSKPPAERKRLLKREQELLFQHRDDWLGELASFFPKETEQSARVRFARGWVDSIRVRTFDVSLARALNRSPVVGLLRELVLVDCPRQGILDYHVEPGEEDLRFEVYPARVLLPRAGYLDNVRVFTLGDLDGEYGFRTYPDGGNLVNLLEKMPRLRELNLNARELNEYELFNSPTLAGLHTLRLERIRLGDRGIQALVGCKHLSNLKVLQIWNARFTDKGARTLARSKFIRPLELLDVSFNWMTPDGIELLRKTGVNLVAEYQIEPTQDNDNEYADDFDDDFDDYDSDWE